MIQRAIDLLSKPAMMDEKEISHFFLGTGSSREVYVFEEKFVIKIPRFIIRFPKVSDFTAERIHIIVKKGIRQTETEIKICESCPTYLKYLLNPVVAKGEFLGMPFVIMPRIKIASEYSSYNIVNINQFLVWYDLCVPRTFRHDLVALAEKYDLYYPDLCENTDNFGIDNENRLLITDYGTRAN